MLRNAVLVLLASLLAGAMPDNACAEDVAGLFEAGVAPVLRAHCLACHSGRSPESGLDLSASVDVKTLAVRHPTWFRVLERIEDGSMPPEGEERVSPGERDAVAQWVRKDLAGWLRAAQRRDGRTPVRRLSRNEYANTIQDLFGIRPAVMRALPPDGRVDGYDKVADALPLAPAHAEGFARLAAEIIDRFPLDSLVPGEGTTTRFYAKKSEQSQGHILELPDGWKVSFNSDTTSGPLGVKRGPDEEPSGFAGVAKPGVYRIRMHMYGYQTDKPMPVGIYVGTTWAYPQILELRTIVEAPPGKPAVLEADVYLRTDKDSDVPGGDGIRLIPFGLGVQVPKNTQASQCKGAGLALQWVEVTGPKTPTAGDQLLYGAMPAECLPAFQGQFVAGNSPVSLDAIEATAAALFDRVGTALFRRDMTSAERKACVTRFMSGIQAGETIRNATRAELLRLMTSPDFLCKVEAPGTLDAFELASRLSYFLWNSTPDEQLMESARKRALLKPAELRAQTERLLKDPRSQRFVEDFTAQWLGLWGVDNTTPDKDLYPGYDELLKLSSVMETRASFRRMLDEDRSVREFVDARWALVNERLAEHYGVGGVSGFALREVSLPPDSPFGGLWTQSALMKVTANGTLTSPVKRGVWVAERLLGVSIPPPPPDISPVDPDTQGATTLREQLALHRSSASCSACHARFDPYGFALENFDVTGAYTDAYRRDGLPVDSSGVTPDGQAFADVRELRRLLAAKPERLAFGIVRHLLTYATGSATQAIDRADIEEIARQAAGKQYGLRSLIHGVVQSELFRTK